MERVCVVRGSVGGGVMVVGCYPMRMSESLQGTGAASVEDADALIRARREKMRRWREELGIDPYGGRVEGLIPLAEARALYSEDANAQHEAGGEGDDPRPRDASSTGRWANWCSWCCAMRRAICR